MRHGAGSEADEPQGVHFRVPLRTKPGSQPEQPWRNRHHVRRQAGSLDRSTAVENRPGLFAADDLEVLDRRELAFVTRNRVILVQQ